MLPLIDQQEHWPPKTHEIYTYTLALLMRLLVASNSLINTQAPGPLLTEAVSKYRPKLLPTPNQQAFKSWRGVMQYATVSLGCFGRCYRSG